MSAASRAVDALPMGLAHWVVLSRDVADGEMLRMADVKLDADNAAVAARADLVARFGNHV